MSKNFRWGAVSITNKRENNEDNYAIDPEGKYFLVADGMGGQAAGEKASEMAAEAVPQRLNQLLDFDNDPPEKVISVIDEAIDHANAEIMSLSSVDSNFHNMGTTLALIVAAGESFYVTGVGDSRVYRLEGDSFTQLTKDHSLTQALVDAGTIKPEEAANHRFKNVLHRYLGTKEGGTGAEIKTIAIQTGDRYLVCSDGVNEGVSDEAAAEILRQNDDPQAAAEALVKASQDGGANDNITCVVLHVS